MFSPGDLKDIEFTPPPYWSGNLSLTLTGIVMELDNGDQVTESTNFSLYIKPLASDFLLLTNDIDLTPSGKADLRLNLVMLDQRGTDPGETPEEIISLTFKGVPNSTFLFATKGGRLNNTAPGTWVFTGTQNQTNSSLQIVSVNQTAGSYFISVDGATQDAGNVLPSKTDDFPFKVVAMVPTIPGRSLEAPKVVNSTITGTAGNDILTGTDFANQTLIGGNGTDLFYPSRYRTIMSGGGGSDQFVWKYPVLGVHEITDFSEAQGDVLNVVGLVDPKFNLQLDDISKVVRLVDGRTAIEVFDGTVWQKVVKLTPGVGAASAKEMWKNGSLLV